MNEGRHYDNVIEVCLGCDASDYMRTGRPALLRKVYGPRSKRAVRDAAALLSGTLRTEPVPFVKYRHELNGKWWLGPLRINTHARRYLSPRPITASPRNERNDQ